MPYKDKAKERERSKRYYREHKEEIKRKQRERYHSNPTKYRKRVQEQRRKLKREIIKAYGGKCECCGEMIWEFLTIDHIHGKGKEHRHSIGSTSATSFYHWLKKNNFPEGFRILCWDCNASLGCYGYCPHQKKELKS